MSVFLIALRKGGVKCSSACPFYTETGKVTGVRGVPLKTHCRMTMNPWMADCDIYNPQCIDKVEVTEEQWKTMLHAVHKRAIRQRKLYPEDVCGNTAFAEVCSPCARGCLHRDPAIRTDGRVSFVLLLCPCAV